MQRRGQETWRITALGKVERHFLVDKVHHALGWCCLLHIALLPAEFFKAFLIAHHAESVITLDILGMDFNDHTAIAPARATIGWRHSVDYYLTGTCGSRNDETARTHTETVHATTIYLSNKTVLGCREVFAPTLRIVILYLVDKMRGVFESHANSNSFRLYIDIGRLQVTIDITGGMACCKYYRAKESDPLLSSPRGGRLSVG